MAKYEFMKKIVEDTKELILSSSPACKDALTKYSIYVRNVSHGSPVLDFSSLATDVNVLYVGVELPSKKDCKGVAVFKLNVYYDEVHLVTIPIQLTTQIIPDYIQEFISDQFWSIVANAAVKAALADIISTLNQKSTEVEKLYEERASEIQVFLESKVKELQDALDEMQLPYVLKLERKVKK